MQGGQKIGIAQLNVVLQAVGQRVDIWMSQPPNLALNEPDPAGTAQTKQKASQPSRDRGAMGRAKMQKISKDGEELSLLLNSDELKSIQMEALEPMTAAEVAAEKAALAKKAAAEHAKKMMLAQKVAAEQAAMKAAVAAERERQRRLAEREIKVKRERERQRHGRPNRMTTKSV